MTTILAVCSLALAFASPAVGQGSPTRKDKATASARFQKGVELYKAGDIRAALIEFKRAYKIAPTYHLLFNIGQASAELRDYVEAHNSFSQYLRDGGSDIDDGRREMVEREISRLKGYLARLDFKISVSAAEVSIDDVVVGVSPLDTPILVGAGRRKVVVSREGHARWERSIDLAGEDEVTLEVELLSLSKDSLPPRPASEPGLGAGFWASAVLTVALGAGTGVAGYLTLRAQSDLEDARALVPTTQSAIDKAADETRRYALVTDVGLGLTAAGVLVTVILAMRGSGSSAEAAASASSRSPAGAFDLAVSREGVAISGRF